MTSRMIATASSLLAGLALLLCGSAASAHDRGQVNWSVSVGAPFPVAQVYSAPPPVYIRPQPVYVDRYPVVQYQPTYYAPQYVEQVDYREVRNPYWRHHHRHHHRDND